MLGYNPLEGLLKNRAGYTSRDFYIWSTFLRYDFYKIPTKHNNTKQSQIRLTYLMSDVLKNHLQEESVLFQTAHFRDYLLVTDQITQTIQLI